MFTTTMNAFLPLPASRRSLVIVIAALGAAALAWGQEAPAAGASADQSTVSAATPAPAVAPTPGAPDAAALAAPATTPATGSERILPAADPNSPAASTLGGTLSGNSTAVAAIQRQELPQRDRLLAELSERVQLADRKLAELQQKGSELDDAGKKALDTAIAEYNRTKAALQHSLENSRSAELNTWDRARSHLASDYAFFVAAAAAVELISPN